MKKIGIGKGENMGFKTRVRGRRDGAVVTCDGTADAIGNNKDKIPRCYSPG